MQNETKKELHTQMWKIENPKDFTPHDREVLEKAAAIIRAGGLVAFPTETVYGLGANALDEAAAKKIYAAKGRPSDNPLIAHVSCLEEIAPLVSNMPENGKKLAKAYWPGPMTMVFPKSAIVPYGTTGGLDTVAVRIPSHPVAREIIRLAGVPVAAPSANLSGSPSPTTAQHCVHDLWGRVDAIVDGGACGVGLESTVISLAGEKPVLLRPGAVTPQMLRELLPDLQIHQAVTEKLQAGVKASSPGMKYKHYAPKAQITILDADSAQFVAYVNAHKRSGLFALCFAEDVAGLQVPYVSLGADEADQARHLFAALRQLDELGAKEVYARCPDKEGVGLAVYNRLIRAAAYHELPVEQE